MAQTIAQCVLALTLVLMVIGRTPLFITAALGACIAGLIAGIPVTGSAPVTFKTLLVAGLNPVLIDMAGILLFIGIMQASGFLTLIIKEVIRWGNRVGGGPGIITAASIVAGMVGMMVGFTQAAITGVIAGPAAIKLGVDPDEAAGALQHANNLGCGAGFAHPTELAILSVCGIGFGWVNFWGALTAFAIMGAGYIRMRRQVLKKGGATKFTTEELNRILEGFKGEGDAANVKTWVAFVPFLCLFVGASTGLPIFLVCFFCALLTIILSRRNLMQSETAMIQGVKMISVPFVATVVFMFLSGVINNTGVLELMSGVFKPLLDTHPVMLIFTVSLAAGVITQSYLASAAIIIPFATMVLGAGVDPLVVAVAACSGGNLGQYFLTGGPISGLNTVIPVVPGSELLRANKFQRPNIICGWIASAIITFGLTLA